MLSTVRFLLGLVCAAAAHVLSLYSGVSQIIDPFLILAVYHSLRQSPAWSAIGGSAVGLVQDALTGGIYGLHGFANTVVAYTASRIQNRVVIQQPLQVGMLCFLAAAVQLAVLAGLQYVLVPRAELPLPGAMIGKMISTGVLGAVVYVLANRTLEWEQNRQERNRRRLRLDT